MKEDVGMWEYINSQLEVCKEINAAKSRVKFEKEGQWVITITVERKDL